jgi:hypothetical protein
MHSDSRGARVGIDAFASRGGVGNNREFPSGR